MLSAVDVGYRAEAGVFALTTGLVSPSCSLVFLGEIPTSKYRLFHLMLSACFLKVEKKKIRARKHVGLDPGSAAC